MKRCPTKCPEDRECAQFASAQCVMNRCTCEMEWKTAIGKTIDCDTPQGQCHKVKDAMIKKGIYKQLQNAEKRAEGEMVEEMIPDVVLDCTPGGSFMSNCTAKGNGKKSCFCLDPNDGKPDHNTPVEIDENEKPNCAVAQKKKYMVITQKIKIHHGSLSDFTESKKHKIITAMCKKVVEVGKMKCGNPRLEEGSVVFVYDASALDVEPTVIVTDDLPSLMAAFQQKITRGEVVIAVDQDTYVASEGAITASLTAEDILSSTTQSQPTTKRVEPDGDDKKTVIIVVVVVVVVVLLLIIAAGCYCYRKSKSKKQEMPFDDIHVNGKSNPAYEKTAY